MSRKFIKVTSGWIPVSVLLLFTAALVTGEPRTGVQEDSAVIETPAIDLHQQIRSSLQDVDSVRHLVDSLGSVPGRVELIIDAGISSANKAEGRSKLLRGFDHE